MSKFKHSIQSYLTKKIELTFVYHSKRAKGKFYHYK